MQHEPSILKYNLSKSAKNTDKEHSKDLPSNQKESSPFFQRHKRKIGVTVGVITCLFMSVIGYTFISKYEAAAPEQSENARPSIVLNDFKHDDLAFNEGGSTPKIYLANNETNPSPKILAIQKQLQDQKIKELNEELAEANKKIHMLNISHNFSDSQRLMAAGQTLSEKEKTIQQLLETVSRLEDEIEQSELQAKQTETALKEKVKFFESEKVSLDEVHQNYQNQIKKLYTIAQGEIEKLRNTIKEKESNQEVHLAQISQQASHISKLELGLKEKDTLLSDANEKLQSLEKIHNIATEEIAESSEQIKTYKLLSHSLTNRLFDEEAVANEKLNNLTASLLEEQNNAISLYEGFESALTNEKIHQSKASQLEDDLKSYVGKINTLEDGLANQSASLSEKQQEIYDLQNAYSDNNNALLTDLESTHTLYNQEKAKLGELVTLYEQEKLKVEAAQALLNQEKTKAEEAQALLDQEKAKAEEAQALLDQEKVKAEEAQALLDQEKAKAEAAQATLDEEKARAETAQALLEQEKANAEAAKELYEQERAKALAIQTEFNELRAAHLTEKEKAEELLVTAQKLSQQLNDSQQELIATKEEASQTFDSLNKEKEAIEQSKSKYAKNMESQEELLNRFTQEIEACHRAIEEKCATVASLESRTEEQKAIIESQYGEVQTMIKAESDLKTLLQELVVVLEVEQTRNEYLSKNLQATLEMHHATQNSANDLEAQLNSYQTKLASLENDVDRHQNIIASKEGEIEALTESNILLKNQLTSNIEKLTQELEQEKQKTTTIQNEFMAFNDHYKAKQQQLLGFSQEVKRLTERLNAEEEVLRDSEFYVTYLVQTRQNLANENARLASAKANLETQYNEKHRVLERQEEQLQKVMAEIDKQRVALAEVDQTRNQLLEEKQKLEAVANLHLATKNQLIDNIAQITKELDHERNKIQAYEKEFASLQEHYLTEQNQRQAYAKEVKKQSELLNQKDEIIKSKEEFIADNQYAIGSLMQNKHHLESENARLMSDKANLESLYSQKNRDLQERDELLYKLGSQLKAQKDALAEVEQSRLQISKQLDSLHKAFILQKIHPGQPNQGF